MYYYLKAVHIIFVVTWFAGLFYMPRFFIYNTEAEDKPEQEKMIIRKQLIIMMKRLWYGITWPSAVLTLIFGLVVLWKGSWYNVLLQPQGLWLFVKLILVLLLYAYHFSLHYIFLQQLKGKYSFSSQQLRIWNEVATLFLVAIVMLATVKQSISLLWSFVVLMGIMILFLLVIKQYKKIRERNKQS